MSHHLRCPKVSSRFQSLSLAAFLLFSVLLAGSANAAGSPLFTRPLLDHWSAASDTHCLNAHTQRGNPPAGVDNDAAPDWRTDPCPCLDLFGQSLRLGLSVRGLILAARYVLPPFRAPPVH